MLESQINLYLSGKWFYLLFFTSLPLSFSLKNLVKHLPEQDQLNALAKYENEYANLSEPEQFGVVVGTHTLTHTVNNFTVLCLLMSGYKLVLFLYYI